MQPKSLRANTSPCLHSTKPTSRTSLSHPTNHFLSYATPTRLGALDPTTAAHRTDCGTDSCRSDVAATESPLPIALGIARRQRFSCLAQLTSEARATIRACLWEHWCGGCTTTLLRTPPSVTPTTDSTLKSPSTPRVPYRDLSERLPDEPPHSGLSDPSIADETPAWWPPLRL